MANRLQPSALANRLLHLYALESEMARPGSPQSRSASCRESRQVLMRPLLGHVLGGGFTLSLSSLLLGISIQTAQAQILALVEQAPPKVVELLKTPLSAPEVTAQTPSQNSLTLPSLWWANEQFGDKMVLNWFTYPQAQASNSQVRLVVRPDLWSRYSYLERYAFLRRFGASTSAAGYHLVVLDRQNYPLAAYICEFSSKVKPAPLFPWEQGQKRSPNPQARCNAWISPVYDSPVL
jgi:hypothetical protein